MGVEILRVKHVFDLSVFSEHARQRERANSHVIREQNTGMP
jgi:hypothetical protein